MKQQTDGVGSNLAAAAALLHANRPAAAIAPLRHAALYRPDDATIHHDLGLACLEAGRPIEAAEAFRQAVAINPRYAGAHFRLGVALESLGDANGAVAAYQAATALLPSMAEAWFRAGALVFTLGHREAAIDCFRRAASTRPKTRFARLGAARALLAEGRDGEAETALRQMLALDAHNPMALDLLGNLLADRGAFDAARDAFERAIARAPLMAGSYYDLARCRPITAADAPLLARMEAALATPGLDTAQHQRVHLAIGKAADDLGDPMRAMRHWDHACAERDRASPFDTAAFDRQIDRLIGRLPQDLLACAPTAGISDATPLLITGMPRSGTTLVEQIVSSHPDVVGGGELTFWNDRMVSLHEQSWDDPAVLAQPARDYLALLHDIGRGAARVTDKMPFNILWAGLIHLALPRATIIHCRRSPIDTALSIHQTCFSPALAFPTGGAALVAYVRSIMRLAAHWRRVLPPDRFIEIDYETLTRTPEPAIRRLIAACGLPWNDACLQPERNPRAVKTPSRWQARQAIHTGAVERWRRYEGVLGPLRALLEDTPAVPESPHP